ncbi:DUF5615 family PIN-like protein [Anabaena cylindrica UHCC 0172]|uniref:DUF5615 family PIN-like protein n=1 Tax=Anabaena cylindrica TaxID=1165 RepID=UPI002B1F05D8|nr:DUF5615 family PIN-like protein [Anabaena cylindrica]MEA5554466.1 DUF5615 family PIN-like protein [Anabaena cylindrica UHCC 0172]
MRFLANENFPLDAVEALRENGHDVAWIRIDSPGISDPQVLSRAQAENRILLTFDKDFGELAFRSQLPATTGIILFRIKAPSGAVVAEKVVKAIAHTNNTNNHSSLKIDKSNLLQISIQTWRSTIASFANLHFINPAFLPPWERSHFHSQFIQLLAEYIKLGKAVGAAFHPC